MDALGPSPFDQSSQFAGVTVTAANQQVLDYIEATFNAIIHELRLPSGDGKPVVALNRIVAVKPHLDEDDAMRLKWHVESRRVRYHFPGKNKDEARRFACVGRILREIYVAIKQGVTITKRDIYYHDAALFKNQETVDRYVDDIAHTCQVTRRDLNVVASPKGLVAGLSYALTSEQAPVIQIVCINTPFTDTEHIKWILVIEKEATFNALTEREFHQNPTIGPGLLVTARGYPDVATRIFLRQLLDHSPSPIPVFGLFDWDPHGVGILKCYLYGSKNLAQEHGCNIPDIRWVGIKAEDVLPHQDIGNPTIQLSKRDRMTAIGLLGSQEWRDQAGTPLPGLQEAVTEVQRMLMLNRKAEIQSLDERPGGLEGWLTGKLGQRL
ncbi:uncharacterized protein A1O5_01370 [Cladophialophora psammophila CBS 110553]|uniref:DNA topoisomerase (ATP-hydrolyzing) n=1 Tax=Cladophialophora psammophila CBS 110553 TaxID=1182543 RepID=W9X2H0_9EURO|nr:uncharacterized protein A1O5_01370 [Cladophialophora psammophila CBS 110553]EXJ74677.1 hypothetical protein A1O5_01370 [Cladophialophora psammophila CBS 110553]